MDGPAAVLGTGGKGVQTTAINNEIIATCWQLYRGNPVMRACRNVIYGILFSGTIELVKDDSVVDLQPEFADFLRRHWFPFAKDCADCLRVMGFVPYVFRRCDDGTDNLVPAVPPVGTYNVEMRTERDFSQNLVLRTKMGVAQNVVPNANFYVSSYPNMRGEIESSMIALAPAMVRLEAMTNAAVECEINAARPTFLTQVRKEGDTVRGNAASMSVATGIAQWASESAAHLLRERDTDSDMATIERFTKAREAAIEYNRKRMDVAGDPSNSAIGSAQSRSHPGGLTKGSVLSLPKGLEYVPQKEAAPHQDLHQMNMLVEDLICAEMGVPNSLVHPSHTSFDSGTLVQRVVNMELVRVAKMLEDVLSMAYESLYSDIPPVSASAKTGEQVDASHAMSYDDGRAPTSSQDSLPTTEQVHQSKFTVGKRKNAGRTRVVLRYPTFCDPELLLNAAAQVDLYDQNYVGELFARAAGFWTDGVTPKYIYSTEDIEQRKRDTKAFETELELFSEHQRAQWAAQAAAAAPQTAAADSGTAAPAARSQLPSLRKPGRPPRGGDYNAGTRGGEEIATGQAPEFGGAVRNQARTARPRPASTAAARAGAGRARQRKRLT